jgi:hypothetical protein
MRLVRGLAVLVVAVSLTACGQVTTKTVTEIKSRPAASVHRQASERAPTSAKKPAKAAATSTGYVSRDTNIEAKPPHTSCGFAENAFYEYWTSGESSSLRVYSPATASYYLTTCSDVSLRVVCRTSDGGRVRFTTSALESYSDSQAETYAASHDVGPDASATDDPASGYGGSSSSSADVPDASEDDSSGDEIPNYDNGTGYRVQCADGEYSHSGGRPGACSGHGGEG